MVQNKFKGMTLAEVLVTMMVLALLLAVGFPGYMRATRERQVESVALQIKNAIDETRQYSMAPINSTNIVQYYCFQISSASRTWTISEYRSENEPVISNGCSGTNISTGTIPSNMNITLNGDNWRTFLTHRYENNVGGGIGEMYPRTPISITVARTGLNGFSKTVRVNTEGVVNVE